MSGRTEHRLSPVIICLAACGGIDQIILSLKYFWRARKRAIAPGLTDALASPPCCSITFPTYDDAYANGPNIVGGDGWAARYTERAAAFRAALPPERQKLGVRYAEASPRQVFDLFLPEGEPRGLVVYRARRLLAAQRRRDVVASGGRRR